VAGVVSARRSLACGGDFRLEGFERPVDMLRYAAGRALMGAGGVLALGCTVGNGLTGIASLAPTSFIALPAMVLAAAATEMAAEDQGMSATLKTIQANNIHMRYAECGSGPLVLFCHGWPESWYSWRHQLAAVSAAGFRCVAPDMRGYGGTQAPEPIEHYSLLHLVGDMAELVKALGESRAVIVGHDWGAPVAWHAALWRPISSPRCAHERSLHAAGIRRHPDGAREARDQGLLPAVLPESPVSPRPSCSRTSAARCGGSTSPPAAISRRRARASAACRPARCWQTPSIRRIARMAERS
jgi:hypothetical protein